MFLIVPNTPQRHNMILTNHSNINDFLQGRVHVSHSAGVLARICSRYISDGVVGGATSFLRPEWGVVPDAAVLHAAFCCVWLISVQQRAPRDDGRGEAFNAAGQRQSFALHHAGIPRDSNFLNIWKGKKDACWCYCTCKKILLIGTKNKTNKKQKLNLNHVQTRVAAFDCFCNEQSKKLFLFDPIQWLLQ